MRGGSRPVAAGNMKNKSIDRRKGRPDSALAVGGDGSPIAPPPEVAGDAEAMRRWAWLLDSFAEINYTPAKCDLAMMAELCLTFADVGRIRAKIATESDTALFMQLNKLLEAKQRIIISLSDRLLLNVPSRLRGLPTPPKEKEVPEPLKQFAGRL